MLKGDSRLASSHLEIYISFFFETTVAEQGYVYLKIHVHYTDQLNVYDVQESSYDGADFIPHVGYCKTYLHFFLPECQIFPCRSISILTDLTAVWEKKTR